MANPYDLNALARSGRDITGKRCVLDQHGCYTTDGINVPIRPTPPAPSSDVATTRGELRAAIRDYGKEAAQKGHIDLECAVNADAAITAHEAAIRADALRRVREKVEKERWTSTVAGVHTEWVPKRRVLEILDEELNHATL